MLNLSFIYPRMDYFGQVVFDVMNLCYIVLVLDSFVVLHDGIIMVYVIFEMLSIYFIVESFLIFYHEFGPIFLYRYAMSSLLDFKEGIVDKDIN